MPSQARLRTNSDFIVIGGQQVPVDNWSVTLANQGSMASARFESSLTALYAAGVDVIALSETAEGAELNFYAGFDGKSTLVFSGILDECEGNERTDVLTVCGRDYAAVLADGAQTVSDINYRNQSIGQVVTQIAQLFGLGVDVTDPGIKAGSQMKGETSLSTRSQTYWSLIQQLAADVGYEAWVTPDRTLHFGPEQDNGSVNMSWMQPPSSSPENPLEELRWIYNPRNNSNIQVKVISQHPQTMQRVVGTSTAKAKTVRGKSTSGTGYVPKKPSQYGRGAANASAVQKSIYYITVNGLTPEQAQSKAEAVARDLAKRQIIICGKLEGLPSLKVHTHINLNSGLFLDGLDFDVAEVTHTFSMTDGFCTEFRALALVD